MTDLSVLRDDIDFVGCGETDAGPVVARFRFPQSTAALEVIRLGPSGARYSDEVRCDCGGNRLARVNRTLQVSRPKYLAVAGCSANKRRPAQQDQSVARRA